MLYDFGGLQSLAPWALYGLPLLLVWSIFWKGLALWHSARRNKPWWFVAFLLINTAGILEIIYLFLVEKVKFDKLFSRSRE